MTTATQITAEQLFRMPNDGYRYELLAGELKKMPPAGWEHGACGGDLHVILGHYVLEHKLGLIFFADTGFLLARDPDTVRAPDIAFIRRERLPAAPPEDAFCPGAPDLAVEVVSPGDTLREVDEKVQAWLAAGAAMVWVVNPKWRNVTVYRSGTDIKVFTENEELEGGEVVPGFRCHVGDIFLNI